MKKSIITERHIPKIYRLIFCYLFSNGKVCVDIIPLHWSYIDKSQIAILQSIFGSYILFLFSHKCSLSYTYLKHHLNHLKLSTKPINIQNFVKLSGANKSFRGKKLDLKKGLKNVCRNQPIENTLNKAHTINTYPPWAPDANWMYIFNSFFMAEEKPMHN